MPVSQSAASTAKPSTALTWVRGDAPNSNGVALDQYRRSLLGLDKECSKVHLARGETMIPEEDRFFVDKVHPNDDGFELYATNVLPHLRKAMG